VTAKKYNETGDSKYLEFSKKVFNGLNSPVLNQHGWLLGVAIENKNAKILNSQLFCVANLMTYYEYTSDERALKLFKKGVDILEKNINDLSEDCGTYYTLSKDRLVSHQKHPEYIQMLERLYSPPADGLGAPLGAPADIMSSMRNIIHAASVPQFMT